MATKVQVETTEADRVLEWRRDVLKEAGVKTPYRLHLAASKSDLHKILRAKKAGCGDKRLVEIFGDKEGD